MAFIMIDARIEEMELDTYTKTIYQRIVFHARNSKLGHIESLENTAKAVNFSKSKVQISIKILLACNMIEIKKYGRNRHAIFIIEPSTEWIYKSGTTHHSSDSRVVPSNTQSGTTYHSCSTISVTRSSELDVCAKAHKKLHTQKSKKPNFKILGQSLARALCHSLPTDFFSNDIATEIVEKAYADKISIEEIELIIHDIEKYRFLTSKLKSDIIEQMKNWLTCKNEFISQKEEIQILKDYSMLPKFKLQENNYFNELPEEFKEWFNTLNNSNKTAVNRDIKKYEKEIFIKNIIPNYLGYRNFKSYLNNNKFAS